MNERPPQPPEGKLIADAIAGRLSIREASRRAGISYGRWRQITSGVQNVSPGSYAAVRAPAGTLARMARAAGVSPAQLEDAGRADAAEALRKMASDRSPRPALVPPLVTASAPGDEDDTEEREFINLTRMAEPADIPVLRALRRLLDPDTGRLLPWPERRALMEYRISETAHLHAGDGDGHQAGA